MNEFWKELLSLGQDILEGVSSFIGVDNWIRKIAKKTSIEKLGFDVNKIISDAKSLYLKGNNLLDIVMNLKSKYDTGGYNLSGEAAVKLGKKRDEITKKATKVNNLNNLVSSNLNMINTYTDTLNDNNRSRSDRKYGIENDKTLVDRINKLQKENQNYVSQIEQISKETH